MSLYQSNPQGIRPGFVLRKSCPNCGADLTVPDNCLAVPGQAVRCRSCHNSKAAKSARQYSSGEMSRTAKLTQAQVAEIRSSAETGAALAKRYGVKPKTIYLVRKRRTWR